MTTLPTLSEHGETPHVPRRWAGALTAAQCVLGLAAAALVVLAIVEFRCFRYAEWTTIALDKAEITRDGDLVYGRVTQGLPPWRPHWDGEPPRAVLVDAASNTALGPPLLLEQSLAVNRRGALWTEDECRFVVERNTWGASGSAPVLRCEAVRSSVPFYACCGAALAAGLGAVLCGQARRVVQTDPVQRSSVLFAEVRTTCFVALSFYTALAFYPGLPFEATNSDTPNIHSFAAARHVPDALRQDALLSDPRNYAWYTPAYVEFVRWWKAAGFHYGTNAACLALAGTLIGLFGYERLFRAASGSAVFAAVAAFGLWFMKAHYPPGEIWSVLHVLPRTVFASFLPWVVLAAIAVRQRTRLWPLAAIAAAALFYVHPVSSPALTGAVLTGLVIAGEGPIWKRFAWGMTAAVAAVAVMLPYTLVYAAKYTGAVEDDPALIAQALTAAREQMAPGFLDLGLFAREFAAFFVSQPRYWIGAACAAWLIWNHGRPWPVRLWMGMGLGFAIVTFVIPAVDLMLANAWDRMPFQVDLLRGVRYLDVFVLGAVGLMVRELPPLAACDLDSSNKLAAAYRWVCGGKLQVATVVLLSLYLVAAVNPLTRLGPMGFEHLRVLSGRTSPAIAPDWELVRVLATVRRPDEVVDGPLYLRSVHIPLARRRKDLGALAYANPSRLVKADRRLDEAERHLTWPLTPERIRGIAMSLGAQLLVLDRNLAGADVAARPETVFLNERYVVVRVPAMEVAAGPADSAKPASEKR